MSNYLKRQPIEIYVLVVLPLAGLLLFAVFDPLFFKNYPLENLLRTLFYFIFVGGYFVQIFFAFLYLPLYKTTEIIGKFLIAKRDGSAADYPALKPFIKSWLFIFFIIAAPSFINSLIVGQVSATEPPALIASVSQTLMNWDYRLFGVYPPFWLQKFSANHFLDTVLLESYRHLGTLLSIIFAGLLLKGRENFRKFFLAFFLAAIIGFPFWYLYPAISPDDMYRKNVLSLPVPPVIESRINNAKAISANLTGFLEEIDQIGRSGRTRTPLVTTNPSMHVAWGIIIAYFGTALWKPFGLFLWPWSLLNMAGAIYTLQHYAVDIFFGAGLGIAALAGANYLLIFDRKYLRFNPDLFSLLETAQKDLKSFWNQFSFLRRP